MAKEQNCHSLIYFFTTLKIDWLLYLTSELFLQVFCCMGHLGLGKLCWPKQLLQNAHWTFSGIHPLKIIGLQCVHFLVFVFCLFVCFFHWSVDYTAGKESCTYFGTHIYTRNSVYLLFCFYGTFFTSADAILNSFKILSEIC